MREDKELKIAIKKLPEKEPALGLWENISQELDNNENSLKRSLYKLPEHSPSHDSWDKIRRELPNRKTVNYRVYSGIAAAILVLLIFSVIINRDDNNDGAVVFYSEEYSPVEFNLDLDFSSTEKAREHIGNICSSYESKCESEHYLQLKSALDNTSEAIEKTREMLSVFPNDPDLSRKLLLFKKQEAKITRELLMLTMKHS